MPNPTHERLAEAAKRLIRQHGRPMQLIQVTDTPGNPDPWNPQKRETVLGGDDNLACKPVQVRGVQTQFSSSERRNDLIGLDDKKILLDSRIKPCKTMRLRDGDVDYSIINVNTIQPGELTILYKLQVRV